MKGKKRTPDQIIVKLREVDGELNGGATIGQVASSYDILYRRTGVTEISTTALDY